MLELACCRKSIILAKLTLRTYTISPLLRRLTMMIMIINSALRIVNILSLVISFNTTTVGPIFFDITNNPLTYKTVLKFQTNIKTNTVVRYLELIIII